MVSCRISQAEFGKAAPSHPCFPPPKAPTLLPSQELCLGPELGPGQAEKPVMSCDAKALLLHSVLHSTPHSILHSILHPILDSILLGSLPQRFEKDRGIEPQSARASASLPLVSSGATEHPVAAAHTSIVRGTSGTTQKKTLIPCQASFLM